MGFTIIMIFVYRGGERGGDFRHENNNLNKSLNTSEPLGIFGEQWRTAM